jgi:hypothetical protein
MKSRSKKYAATLILCCCVAVLFCPGCKKGKETEKETSKFEVDKVFERGPVTVHIRLDKSKLTIAETLLLELEAAAKPGYQVQMPKVDKVLENFGIVDWRNLGSRLDENNNVVSRYQYRLEPFVSGTYPIPAFTFEFTDANSTEGKKYELATEPINVEVTSLLGEDRSKLAIGDIEGVVEMARQNKLWRLWAVIAAGIVTTATGWYYLRSRQAEKLIRIFKPAHEIAYERLRRLVEDDLIAAGRIKEFYERISDILRHYLEHRFNLKAPERTTEEFLIELHSADVLSGGDQKNLGEFLMHCDLVKFAKYDPTKEQIQRTFDLVRELIEKTKSDEKKIDITDKYSQQETVNIGSK